MKKIILGTVLVFSIVASAGEWISPSSEVCSKNGGELSRSGVCYANFNDAKRICSNTDATLPTLDDLRGLLASCGGKFDDYNMHKDDPAFQSCSKKNGFDISRHYWSSTNSKIDGYAMGVRFVNGYEYDKKKDGTLSVQCVKIGQ
ncbi:MAG: hypothetical protein B6D54_04180 [Epsilonproteobacteria bacterium 4484_65]|nr:MAG: hypothetical protein B6D54_04180 [Epsilonproteobacteria bacterium 4484_65]